MTNLEHRVVITKARDCFDGCEWGDPRCKPGSGGFHGQHGSELRMYAVGPLGAIQFVVFTMWGRRASMERTEAHVRGGMDARMLFGPMPADLGYHAREPQYDGQTSMGECDILGGDCFYDGSGLAAEEVFETLVAHGIEAVWNRLDAEYAIRFVEGQS